MRSTLANVGVWNYNTCYLATSITISAIFCVPLNIGVNDFEFFVGLTVQE